MTLLLRQKTIFRSDLAHRTGHCRIVQNPLMTFYDTEAGFGSLYLLEAGLVAFEFRVAIR